jgi:hypothetical protein
MPKVQQSSGHGHGGSARPSRAACVHLARRDQRRPAGRRHARAADHLHGGGADDDAGDAGEPAEGREREERQREADLRDGAGDVSEGPRVQIGNDSIPVNILEERVKQALLETTDKSLFVRGDGDVAWKDIIFVFDRLKAAGIEKVGVVTQPVGSK